MTPPSPRRSILADFRRNLAILVLANVVPLAVGAAIAFGVARGSLRIRPLPPGIGVLAAAFAASAVALVGLAWLAYPLSRRGLAWAQARMQARGRDIVRLPLAAPLLLPLLALQGVLWFLLAVNLAVVLVLTAASAAGLTFLILRIAKALLAS